MDDANAASGGSPTPTSQAMATSGLRARVLSALVLIPVLIALVWVHYWTLVITAVAAATLALTELFGMFRNAGLVPRQVIGYGITIALLLATAVQPFVAGGTVLGMVLMLAVVLSLGYEVLGPRREPALLSWGMTLAGALYIGWLFSHFIMLRALGDAPVTGGVLAGILPVAVSWIFLTFAATWLQDTGAYFAGRAFGKRLMAPQLSPKKTWEGALGGLLGAVVGAVLATLIFGIPLSLPLAVLFGVVAGVVGPIGDLAESFIKRQAGTKDAGKIIPGHGGLLDRGDSLIFTGAVFYWMIVGLGLG